MRRFYKDDVTDQDEFTQTIKKLMHTFMRSSQVAKIVSFSEYYFNRFEEGRIEVGHLHVRFLLPPITIHARDGTAYTYHDIFGVVGYGGRSDGAHTLEGGRRGEGGRYVTKHPHAGVRFCTRYQPRNEWNDEKWWSVMDQAILHASTYTVRGAWGVLPEDEITCTCGGEIRIEHDEEIPACPSCDRTLCGNCARVCDGCDTTYCPGCSDIQNYCSEECLKSHCYLCHGDHGTLHEARTSIFNVRTSFNTVSVHDDCMGGYEEGSVHCAVCHELTIPQVRGRSVVDNFGVTSQINLCTTCLSNLPAGVFPSTIDMGGVSLTRCRHCESSTMGSGKVYHRDRNMKVLSHVTGRVLCYRSFRTESFAVRREGVPFGRFLEIRESAREAMAPDMEVRFIYHFPEVSTDYVSPSLEIKDVVSGETMVSCCRCGSMGKTIDVGTTEHMRVCNGMCAESLVHGLYKEIQTNDELAVFLAGYVGRRLPVSWAMSEYTEPPLEVVKYGDLFRLRSPYYQSPPFSVEGWVEEEEQVEQGEMV